MEHMREPQCKAYCCVLLQKNIRRDLADSDLQSASVLYYGRICSGAGERRIPTGRLVDRGKPHATGR
jgi:hypothetical protein